MDRGTYAIGANSYRGMRNTCDGDLTCVDGLCVPLPSCNPGSLSECSFAPQGTLGMLSPFVLEGEFVYWSESGTTDARGNPFNNGVIARTRLGMWAREELATGLDFFDDDSRAFVAVQLATSANSVLWSSKQAAGYVSGLAQGPRIISRQRAWASVPWSDGCVSRDSH